MIDIVEQARGVLKILDTWSPVDTDPSPLAVVALAEDSIKGLLSRLAEVESQRDSANERLVGEVESSRLSEKRAEAAEQRCKELEQTLAMVVLNAAEIAHNQYKFLREQTAEIDTLTAENAKMRESLGDCGLVLSRENLNLIRQWFNAVMDANPAYLMRDDYQIAIRICEATGNPTCERMRERTTIAQ